MTNCLRVVTILAGLLLWQTARARADEAYFAGRDAAQARPPIPARLPPTGATVPGNQSFVGTGPAYGPPADRGLSENASPFANNSPNPQGQFINPFLAPGQSGAPYQGAMNVGVVNGRLLNKGRPLAHCHVVIVPLHEEQGVYCFDPQRQVLNTTTDENGAYRFENVPAGGYKLTWLPDGQNRWIRRIAMSPDITVRSGESTKAKEIRIAMQTIN